VFWGFQFYGPECHRFTRTKPLVLSKASLSQGLTQSKTLDCERADKATRVVQSKPFSRTYPVKNSWLWTWAQRGDHLEVHDLTDQVVCLVAELVLFPKQNLRGLNSRRGLLPSEGRKYQAEFPLPKSPYLY